MKSILSGLLYSIFCIFLGVPSSQASDLICPKEIASIEGDPLSEGASEVLVSIYKDLGCDIIIRPRPGLRGVVDFNKYRMDGELYRLDLVESSYERDFIRSRTPLFSLKNSLWLRKELKNSQASKIVGYVPGINWHAKVVKENTRQDINFAPFHTETELYNAYLGHKIVGFLSEKQTVDLLMREDRFEIRPVDIVNYGERPLYHYLGGEFQELMDRFSNFIAKENPYQHLN